MLLFAFKMKKKFLWFKTWICIPFYTNILTHGHTHTYTYTHTHTYTYTHKKKETHVCLHSYTRPPPHTQAHIHTRTSICTHTFAKIPSILIHFPLLYFTHRREKNVVLSYVNYVLCYINTLRHTHVHTHAQKKGRKYTHVCINSHTRTHTHTQTYTRTNISTHTCTKGPKHMYFLLLWYFTFRSQKQVLLLLVRLYTLLN